MPDLYILGLEFESNIVIFQISTFEFALLQNFAEKHKCLNLGPNMPDLGVFGLEFENNIVIFKLAPSDFSNCEISRK